jgi:hypothetical protein
MEQEFKGMAMGEGEDGEGLRRSAYHIELGLQLQQLGLGRHEVGDRLMASMRA